MLVVFGAVIVWVIAVVVESGENVGFETIFGVKYTD